MKFHNIIEQELIEDIIGKKYGIFYHRTKSDFSDVLRTRFKPGFGGGAVGMGEGWYFSSSLKDVKKTNPEYLGKNIVKARVDLRKVFFADSKEADKQAVKIHGGSKTSEQLKSIGVPQELIDKASLEEKNISVYDIPKNIKKYIEGYVYGKKAKLLYMKKKPNILNRIIPYSISKDNGETWEKLSGSKYKKRAFKLAREKI